MIIIVTERRSMLCRDGQRRIDYPLIKSSNISPSSILIVFTDIGSNRRYGLSVD
jgi:hypothetical protein